MSLDDLGNIGEFVGAIAVVVSLLYLAFQIRQNTESIRMSAGFDLSQQVSAWHSRMVADTELARLWDAAAEHPSALTPEEARRFRWLIAEVFFMYEGQYEFYRRGHITDDSWQPKAESLQALLKNPIIQEWFDKKMSPFSGDYRRYLESLRARPDGFWTHQSVAGSRFETE